MIDAQIDLRGLEKALELAVQYSSRTTAEVINAACLDIIIKSAERIPKADPGKIEKKLYASMEVSVLTDTGRFRKSPKLFKHPSRLVYNIINAKRRKQGLKALTGDEMKKAAQKLIRARVKSVGYIAYAGFQKAILAYGGRGFGSRLGGPFNEKSKAAQGYGFKAEPGRLWAEFTNRAEHAFEIGGQIVQDVVNWKAEDIRQHVERKLREKFERL